MEQQYAIIINNAIQTNWTQRFKACQTATLKNEIKTNTKQYTFFSDTIQH